MSRRKHKGYLSGYGRGLAIAGPVTVRDAATGAVKRIEPPITDQRRVPAHKVRMQQRRDNSAEDLLPSLYTQPPIAQPDTDERETTSAEELPDDT